MKALTEASSSSLPTISNTILLCRAMLTDLVRKASQATGGQLVVICSGESLLVQGPDLRAAVSSSVGSGRVAADLERLRELRAACEGNEEPAGERVACAEGVGAVDGLHLDAHELVPDRGDRTRRAELDAGDAVVPRERECGLVAVEPGQHASLLGVREQDAGRRRRRQETVDAERGEQTSRRRVDGEVVRSCPLERGARGGLGLRLQERVARDENGTRLEGRRKIVGCEPGTRAGIGDDRSAAHDDDAACPRLCIAGEQRLDAGRHERVRHQSTGRVRTDATDHGGARPEACGSNGCIRCRPACAQLDAAVHAAACDGGRKRSVEHHVADGDQVIRHGARSYAGS